MDNVRRAHGIGIFALNYIIKTAMAVDINDLGTFSSINAVWKAHPEGGHEGDYLTIGSVKYRWNKYLRIWENASTVTPTPARLVTTVGGDLTVNNDTIIGDELKVRGDTYLEGDVKVEGMLDAKAVKQPNRGFFQTEEALKAAYPKPEVGWWATVGDVMPGTVYRCQTEGVWTNTGRSGGVDTERVYFEIEDSLDSVSTDKALSANQGKLIGIELSLIDLAGYFFAGIIIPDSVPPSPPVKNTFWIAQWEGIYTNYGNITIPEYGLYAVAYLASDQSWRLIEITKWKEEALFDNGYPTTSGALYDERAYSKMIRNASNMDGDIQKPTIATSGYYIEHATGNAVAWDYYNISQPIQLLKGQTISYFGSVNRLVCAIAKCDSAGTSIIPLVEGRGANVASAPLYYSYTADSDCYICFTLNNSETVLRDYKNHSYYAIVEGGSVTKYIIEPLPQRGYHNQNGSFVAHENYITRVIYPSIGDVIDYSSWMTWQYSVVVVHNDDTLTYIGDSFRRESLSIKRGQLICDRTVKRVYINTLVTDPPSQDVEGLDDYDADIDAWGHLTSNKQQLYDSVLTDRTWCALGDSITAAVNTTYVDKSERSGLQLSYQNIIADRTGMRVYTNAVGGRTLVKGSNTNNLFNNDAYKSLPACDYLTLWFGVNDAYTTRAKGSIDDTSNTTFYGAWNILLSYFIENMPNTKIGIIIPYAERKQIEQTDDASPATWQRFLDFVDATRNVARKYGIKVLDLLSDDVSMFVWRDNGVVDNTIVSKRFANFTYDGTHPNQAGYNFLAPIIMEWLKTL